MGACAACSSKKASSDGGYANISIPSKVMRNVIKRPEPKDLDSSMDNYGMGN
jgi:hypothetical protein